MTGTTPFHAMPRRGAMLALAFVALGWLGATAPANAQARAWLDRDRIVLGETATLNIETERAGAAAPDYAALRGDFRLSGHTSRRSVELRNGRRVSRSLFAVALEPRRAGVVGIPALSVGGERTPPLALTVLPRESAAAPARAGETVFIEVAVDDAAPYVQQAVGVVVRLHHAVPLVSGQLDVPAPDGATLQRVGDDIQYTRELAGRRYSVLERRFLLIPERSGTLALPSPVFEGRGIGGFFDDLFGDGVGDRLQARGSATSLRVQPVPAAAPQPWLPVHDLRLRYVAAPRQARAGEAATVVVEATVDGAGGAAVPELELRAGAGAQVFAEPAQVDERLRDGRPQATVTRRFSVVPARAGPLRIEGPALGWWDVGADAARTASLPPLELDAAPGTGGFAGGPAAAGPAAAPGAGAEGGTWDGPGDGTGGAGRWVVAAAVFALLWLATLAWALRRQPPPPRPGEAAVPQAPRPGGARLRRALDRGDLGDVLEALHAMAPAVPGGPAPSLRERLAEASQRDAVDAIEQARWGDGDAVAARAAARQAFARGPRWRDAGAHPRTQGALPPLYPD